MTTPLARLAMAGALVLVTTTGGAFGALAATGPAPSPPTHVSDGERATSSPFLKADGKVADTSTTSGLQAEGDVVELASACPSGKIVNKVYDAQSFESGLPFAPEPEGSWTTVTGSAPHGQVNARSDLAVDAAQQDQAAWLQTTAAAVPTSGSLYMQFAYRGTLDNGEGGIYVNNWGGALESAPSWTRVYLDVTATNGTFESGWVYAGFENWLPGSATGPTDFEIDDVRFYSCASAPNAGVRGDWSGEGTVDLLGTHTTGDLYLYPGLGNGKVGGGTKIGSGWGDFNWQGSPGDVTGDRRTDLVGRKADGSLYLYAGRGAGSFASGVKVGSSWQSMTSMATPGDMNLDGRPELLARRVDGTLHVYSFSSTGALSYLKQVGSGWNGMTWIIGMGDLNGDRRGDTVGVNQDGCIYAYTTSTSLTLGSVRKVGCGWGTMNWLTSPGDMDRDGFGDLIARRSDGTLWFYRGRSGGGVLAGIQVGSGWQGMQRIL
ncbi:MAG TPA: VCBS repeat-containing protein [Dermatophilaceae bacterium]|nr:VCBS repeat-containing protein [Dermatophilaceae bacterium]